MKYNPVVNEQLASLEGFALAHPYQEADDTQGALQLMWELEKALCEITGMQQFSMQPAAGAHGEWTGLRIIQAFHDAHGQAHRNLVLVPDSAHGTNPASAALCGMSVQAVASNAQGKVNLDDLRANLSNQVAAVMLTNPNTLGVFETDILEITKLAHDVGAKVYYDGANLNALVGVTRPGDMGFDVVHLNLHKTFSTPHGGGGPGAGPVGVTEELSPYLPYPTVEHTDGRFWLQYERPQSIGKVRSFFGNFGMLVRAYAFIRTYGNTISSVAQHAVLNARYMQKQMQSVFPSAVKEPCMHEFVCTTEGGPVEGLRAVDVAKRLIDYGVYPPTVYFPLTVHEAMMVEPTESESKGSIDAYVEICASIVEEAKQDLAFVKAAPHNAPVSRVDETQAARHPILRWSKDVIPR
jgi:glycine dehydrogenase subunit 2